MADRTARATRERWTQLIDVGNSGEHVRHHNAKAKSVWKTRGGSAAAHRRADAGIGDEENKPAKGGLHLRDETGMARNRRDIVLEKTGPRAFRF